LTHFCNFISYIINIPSAIEAVADANTKAATGPNLSQSIPATKLDGRVIIPVKVAIVPSAVALYDGLDISERYMIFVSHHKYPYKFQVLQIELRYSKEN